MTLTPSVKAFAGLYARPSFTAPLLALAAARLKEPGTAENWREGGVPASRTPPSPYSLRREFRELLHSL